MYPLSTQVQLAVPHIYFSNLNTPNLAHLLILYIVTLSLPVTAFITAHLLPMRRNALIEPIAYLKTDTIFLVGMSSSAFRIRGFKRRDFDGH